MFVYESALAGMGPTTHMAKAPTGSVAGQEQPAVLTSGSVTLSELKEASPVIVNW